MLALTLVSPPLPVMVPSKVCDPVPLPSVNVALPSATVPPPPVRLPMVVAKPPRLNAAPAVMFSSAMPVVVPIRFTVPRLMRLPESTPERLAIANALFVSPPASVPVDRKLPALVIRPWTLPLLMKLALFWTAPANSPPLASTSDPPAIVVSPV